MTISSLQHIALTVPDAAAGKKFYGDFGLEAREDGGRIVMRCHGRDQDQVILVEGPKKRLHHISFGARADALEEIKARLAQNGTRLLDPPRESPDRQDDRSAQRSDDRAGRGRVVALASRSFATSAFPMIQMGRLSHCPFRGRAPTLRWSSVHSRYGLLTRGVAKATLCIEGSDSFVTSTAAPMTTGWNNKLPGRINSR